MSVHVEASSDGGPPKLISAAANARLFFTQYSELARSTLAGYRWQIQQIYAQNQYGPVPWDMLSGHAEATRTYKFINRLIHCAAAPQPQAPLDHMVFTKLVYYWANGGQGDRSGMTEGRHTSRNTRPPLSAFAMAAAACFLRGTAGRSQDLVRLRSDYVRDRKGDGFDFVYPELDPDTQEPFTRKGRRGADSRRLVMPERLSDGCNISQIFRDYLEFAPKSGPLFQTTMSEGNLMGWSGKGWSASTVTDKLRKALADVSLGLGWSKEQILRFSAHSFRAGSATDMETGGVSTTLVAKALHHQGTSVTTRSYINPSDSHIRHSLSVTGSRP